MNEIENESSQKFVMRKWRDLLLSYFQNIKDYENKIDSLRTNLNQLQNFSVDALFQILDQNSKSFISLTDLINFCQNNNIQYEEKYLRKLIHNFDKDNNFSLNLVEFTPLVQSVNNKLNQYNNFNNQENQIDENAISIFAQILTEEMGLVESNYEIAKKMKESPFFTLYESFVEIAGNEKYITENNLYNFLTKNNVDINQNELHQLMFRIDADNDGQISFSEFQEIFFPIESGNFYISQNMNNNKKIYSNINNINSNRNQKYNKSNGINNFTFSPKPENYNKSNYDFYQKKSYNEYNNENINYDDINYSNNNNYINNNNYVNDNNYINDNNNYSNSNFAKSNGLDNYTKKNDFKNNNYSNNNNLMNNTNFTSNNNYSNINVYESSYSKNISSPIYKKINPKRQNNKRPGYKSPKIKHTRSPLHYDYSCYANEDCEKCDNRTHLLNQNQSMISLKSNGNKNFRKNFDVCDYSTKENDNTFVCPQNERTNSHCCPTCNCCGCCGPKNFLINITPVNDKNNSMMDSCPSLYNSQNMGC